MPRPKKQKVGDDGRKKKDPVVLTSDADIGETVDTNKEYRWAARHYHLTYKTHIPFETLKSLVASAFAPAKVIAFSAVHERSDKDAPYDHTHVYFYLEYKCRRRGNIMDVGEVHPHVQTVFGEEHAHAIFGYHLKAPVGSAEQWGEDLVCSEGKTNVIWRDIHEKVKEGVNPMEIAASYPGQYYPNRSAILAEAVNYQTLQPLQILRNYWLFGPSCTGKSVQAKQMAKDYYPGQGVYYKNPDNKWWDGYTGQPVVIIEEMSPKHGQYANVWKQLFDVEPMRVELKGSAKLIRPEMIIVTSNYELGEVFGGTILCQSRRGLP